MTSILFTVTLQNYTSATIADLVLFRKINNSLITKDQRVNTPPQTTLYYRISVLALLD